MKMPLKISTNSGTIPIMKCSDIGDFKKLKYEYQMIDDIEDGLKK